MMMNFNSNIRTSEVAGKEIYDWQKCRNHVC